MEKRVLRFPMKLDAAGRFERDSLFETGMRFITTVYKKTLLGRPTKGLALVFLEQSVLRMDAERMLFLASLFLDIVDFIPIITLIDITTLTFPEAPRRLGVQVRYVAHTSLATVYVFNFGLSVGE